MSLEVLDFGLTEYEAIWRRQKERVTQRIAGSVPDALFVGQHPHVITLGRGAHAENLLNPEIPILEIERGGDVTYHGPGQLIAYPIVLLQKRDLHWYLRQLEEVLIQTLAEFGLQGMRNSGWTGVWVVDATGDLKKIASIGVAVKQWVTYHGVALNVSTDLRYFRQINPCGLESQVMTTMEQLLSSPIEFLSVQEALIHSFSSVFTLHSQPLR